MDDDGETGCFQPGQGVLKHGQRIAPADEAGSAVMDGLQAQLHPDGLAFVQLCQQVDHIRRQTVRTGADGQGCNVRMIYGCCEQLPQASCGRIGIRKRLKIGDKLLPTGVGICRILQVLLAEHLLTGLDLFRDGKPRRRSKFPGASGAAENTAAGAQGAVPVGAGHAAVQRNLVKLLSELLL